MVETSYIELCFVLPAFLQNLHNCFFLSMLLIPYYTTVFRGQSQNRWYKTAMLLNNILNLLASGIPFSTSRMHYSFVTLKARAFCIFVWRCQSNLFHGHGFRVTLVRHGIIIIAYQLRTTCQVRKNSRELAGFASSAVKLHCYSL